MPCRPPCDRYESAWFLWLGWPITWSSRCGFGDSPDQTLDDPPVRFERKGFGLRSLVILECKVAFFQLPLHLLAVILARLRSRCKSANPATQEPTEPRADPGTEYTANNTAGRGIDG